MQILELTKLLEQAGEIRSTLNVAAERYPRLGARVAVVADPR